MPGRRRSLATQLLISVDRCQSQQTPPGRWGKSLQGERLQTRGGGRTIASATKPSAFRRSFEVVFDQTDYKLETVSPFVRRFVLRKDRRVVGSIHPVHLFSRKAIVELPEYLPLEVQLFIAWLVIMLWKRGSSRSRSLHGN